LEKKKEEKRLLDTKYGPIVNFVVDAIKVDELDHRLVLSLIAERFE
jgi:hypothetical protein